MFDFLCARSIRHWSGFREKSDDPLCRFPREVLQNITGRLSQKTLCTLTCVSRAWHVVIIPELYNTISITKEVQTRRFLNLLSNPSRAEQLLYYVRKLELASLSEQHILPLARTCPSLVEFSVASPIGEDLVPQLQAFENIRKISLHLTISKWPPLSMGGLDAKITRLSLHARQVKEWVRLLPKLPCIEGLNIACPPSFTTCADDKFSFSELEIIHERFPHLCSLGMDGVCLQGDIPEHVSPCFTLQSLTFVPGGGSLQWGNYFARKYTNLETLNVSRSLTGDDHAQIETIPLALSCRKLKYLSMNLHPDVYRTFLGLLQEMSSPLTSVCLDSSWDDPSAFSILHGFQKTLSAVSIRVDSGAPLDKLMEYLTRCPSLVNLHLDCRRTPVSVDWLLNQLPHLERLSIIGSNVGVSKTYLAGNKYLSLKHLSMEGEDIEDAVYCFLSAMCPRLSSLYCTYRNPREESRHLCYLNPGLKSLYVHYIQYTENCPADSCFGPKRGPMFKLVRTDSSGPMQKASRATESLSIEDDVRWYCDGMDVTERFRRPTRLGHSKKKSEEKDIEHRDRHNHATVLIRCHYVERIQLNSLTLYN
ncbi:hypothetical protein EC973_006102 [Apophysomyces ossiformis]|uniref:F-box domain-containing protein n=1 Tax=Apophysomyces ossiformis TaxID=679940 RepID=A0A8H7EUM9_9FUNG|nr:hypothetical protein EC973_006102 [Apophysomyces ossiformis]